MVQQKQNGPPARFSEDNVAAHPSLRKDGVDVDNFLADKQVYTREYLESVRPLHRAPTTWYEGVAWAWHLTARTLISLLTLSWVGDPFPSETALGLRMLAFSGAGVAGGAAGATTNHWRSVLFNVSDNGWAHLATRAAENARMHGGAIALALRPPAVWRAAALFVQALLYAQFVLVDMLLPSVTLAYAAYRAEEQLRNADMALRMLDQGRASPTGWLLARASGLACSYYGLPSMGATMRDVLLRIRADEACNRHICFVLAGLRPGSKNPFVVSAKAE